MWWRTLAAAFSLFLLNAYVAVRLFWVGLYDHLGSAEGLFAGLVRYIAGNWNDLAWLPLFYTGMPLRHVYAPGLLFSAASVESLTGWDAIRSYHFAIGLAYCAGPPLLFWMAWRLSGRFYASLCAGLVWSLFSPSSLILRSVAIDNGYAFFDRRLHSIVHWGDAPNAVTLGFVCLAVGALHLALSRGKRVDYVSAALSFALVLVFSWPATVALGMAIICYVLTRRAAEWLAITGRVAALLAVAYALVAIWIPPSTLLATYARTQLMDSAPQARQIVARIAAALAIASLMAVARWLLGRASLWFRFATLFTILTAGIVMSYEYLGITLIAQPIRFHLVMEIAVILLLVFSASRLLAGRPRLQGVVAILLISGSVWQTIVARRLARSDMRPIEPASRVEAEVADWFDHNMHGARVWVPGSISFWMNAFTDTPQLAGCCDQSNTNPLIDVGRYDIAADDHVENRELWLRALGVHALAVGGPRTREPYKAIQFSDALLAKFPCPWHDGDDHICLVPSRTNSLAHVMKHTDLAPRSPVGGGDIGPLRPFVAALENRSYPVVALHWPNKHGARADLNLTPDEILSLQITYFPGWRATANGREVPVQRDHLGFMYIEPRCDGACSIELNYDGGLENRVLWWIRALTLLGAAGWAIYGRFSGRWSANPS